MVDGMSDMGTTELGAASTPEQARAAFRDGLVRLTCGIAQGYAQANLMILPKEQAFDFLLFAQRNPKPCPLLEVMEPGVTALVTAPGADIRTDVPLYRVWKRGELVAEVPDIREYWRSDLVTFVIGCSFTFEFPLMEAGVRIYEYTPGFIHAKSYVCDDEIAVVGTINMDYRSLYLHFECGVLMYGGSAIEALKQDALKTFEISHEVSIAERTRGKLRKLSGGLLDSILRVFAPLF